MRRLLLLVASLATLGSSCALADEANELWLRRIFVPQDDLAAWPTDGTTYLPVDRTRFEKFLVPTADVPAAFVARANYRVNIDASGQVTGTLSLAPTSSESAETTWLQIVAAGVRLIEARDAATGETIPLGYAGRGETAGDDSALVGPPMLCRGATSVEIDWSTSLERLAENIVGFNLPATDVLAVELAVEFPSGFRIEPMSGQLVTSITEGPARVTAKLAIAPTSQLAVRLIDINSPTAASTNVVPLRETIEHRLSIVGDRITARFAIDSNDQSDGARAGAEILSIDIPERLTVTSITIDGKPLAFRQTSSESAGRIVAELPPRPGDSKRRVCVVEAWVPLPLGEPLELPQPVPRGVVWTEGRIIVEHDTSLELADMRGESAVPVAGDDGEANRSIWQKVTQNGRCVVVARVRPLRVSSDVGHRVSLSASGTDADTIWSIDSRERHMPPTLTADVADDWVVESVTTEPADRLRDWYLDENENCRRLVLQLSPTTIQTATTGNEESDGSLVVRIASRLAKSARDERLPIELLEPIAPNATTPPSRLLGLTSLEGLEVKLTGAVTTRNFENLSPRQQSLFDEVLPVKLIDLDDSLVGVSVHLESEKSQLGATIATKIASIAGEWHCEYSVECVPTQGPIDRCEIYFSGPLDPATRWFDADNRLPLKAELLPASENSQRHLPDAGQVWRVRLAKPTETAARMVVVLPPSDAASWQLPLASVLAASVSDATIGLVSDGQRSIAYLPTDLIRTTRRRDSTSPLASAEIARWTYDPQQLADTHPERMPRLEIAHEPEPPVVPHLVVAKATLESRYASFRPSLHRYSATIQHVAAATLRCDLPPRATAVRYQLAGRTAQVATAETTFTCELDDTQDVSTLVIEFEFPDADQLAGTELSAPWPRVDAPLVESEWSITLPAKFSIRSEDQPYKSPANKLSLLPSWPLISTASANSTGSHSRESKGGWHTASFRRLGGPVASVRIDDGDQRSLVGLMALVAALVAGFYLANSLRWWMLAIGCLLAIAVAATDNAATIATCAAIGLLIGAGWRWRPRAVGMAKAAALLLTIAVPTVVRADTLDIEKVFVPADTDGESIGERVFVSPRLLDMIGQREREVAKRGPEFLVESLRLDVDVSSTSGSTMTASWTIDVTTFRGDCRVVLPLERGDSEWQPMARVSGIPTPLEWNETGSEASLIVAEPGTYRVVLQASQTVTVTDGRAAACWPLPPVPRANLTIESASQLRELRVEGVSRTQELRTSGYFADVPLTTTSQIAIDWQASESLALPLTPARASITSLVQVTGESTSIDMQLRVTGYSAQRPLLLPLASPVAAVLIEMLESSVVEKPLAVDAAGNLVIDAADLVAATKADRPLRVRLTIDREQPVGVIPLPVKQLPVGCRGTHLMGVVCDDTLDAAMKNATASVSLIDADEFLGARGGDFDLSPRIRFAANVTDMAQGVQLAVTPRTVLSGTEETLRLFCQARICTVRYQTDFGVPSWPRLRQVFRVSPELNIASVSASTSEGTLPLSFHRASESRLVVLFDQPVDRAYRLRIEAEIELASVEGFKLPRLVSLGNASMSQRIVFYCDPSLVVEVPEIDGVTKLGESTFSTPADWVAYPVGSYRIEPSVTTEVPLKLTANRLRYRVQNLLRIEPAPAAWQVENVTVVNVTDGQLVELAVDLPANIAGPIDVEPPAYVMTEPLLNSEFQRVKLRFPQAMPSGMSHLIRLRYDAPVTSARGFDVRLPRYVGARGAVHWLATPRESTADDGWNLRGTASGSGADELPTSLASRYDPDLWNIAKIVSPGRFAAQWRSSRAVETKIRLAAAHHHVSLDAVGSVRLRSRLLLYPSIHEECNLSIPIGHRVIGLTVDGQRSLVEPTADGTCLLTLGPASLPHVIDIDTMRAAGDIETSVVIIEPPQLAGDNATSERASVLWSFANESTDGESHEAGWMATGAEPVLPRDRATISLSRWMAVSSEIASGVASLPADSTGDWQRWWGAQIAAQRAQLQLAMGEANSSADIVTRPENESDRQALIESAEVLEKELSGGESISADADLRLAGEATFLVRTATLRVERVVTSEAREWMAAKWTTLLLVVCAAALVMFKPVAAWLADQPFLLLAIVGAGLSFLLSPIWLGIALSLAALIAWGRSSRSGMPSPRATTASQ